MEERANISENELENIVNSIPGGIAIYKLHSDRVEVQYFTDGIPTLSGFTAEEYKKIAKDDASKFVYERDRDYVAGGVREALEKHIDIDLTFRRYAKNDSLIWVHMQGRKIREEDGCPILHTVYHNISKTTELYREILDISDRVLIVCDRDTLEILYANKKAMEICQHPGTSYFGHMCYEYFYGHEEPCVHCQAERLKKEDTFTMIRYIAGLDHYHKITVKAINWNGRNIFVKYITDVTQETQIKLQYEETQRSLMEQKEQDKQRYEMEMKKHIGAEKNLIAMCGLDLATKEIIDYDADSKLIPALFASKMSLEEAWKIFMDTAIDQQGRKNLQEICTQNRFLNDYKKGKETMAEYQRLMRSGGIIWVRIVVKMLKNPTNNHLILFAYTYDINEEKNLQSAIAKLTEKNYDMMMCIDEKNNRVRYFGRKPKYNAEPRLEENDNYAEAVKKYFDQYVLSDEMSGEVITPDLARIMEKLKHQDYYSMVYAIKCKDGEIRRKRTTFFYINKVQGLIGVVRSDTTDIYHEEQERKKILEGALEEATNANQAKSEFLSRISHDMRTPMNVIMGLTNMTLEFSELPEGVLKNLHEINESSRYLLSLINDTLDMNKIESRKIVLKKEVANIRELMGQDIAFFRPLLKKKNIQFNVIKPDGSDEKYIYTDVLRLHQIFQNLITNAIKFTPDNGAIECCVKRLLTEEKYYYDEVRISDNGIGMSKEFLAHAFEPFEQEKTEVSSNYEGSGLGLSIVKSLVELMGGTIRIESEKNVGTTVIFELKLQVVPENEIKNQEKKEKELHLAGTHILLCEDHPLNAKIALHLLEKQGCIVDVTENGQLGVEQFMRNEVGYYDVVLMDIRMPVMDGLTAARTIRHLNRGDAKTVVIIAMTANAFDEDVQDAIGAGMDAHLSKPIDAQVLYQTLNNYIKQGHEHG